MPPSFQETARGEGLIRQTRQNKEQIDLNETVVFSFSFGWFINGVKSSFPRVENKSPKDGKQIFIFPQAKQSFNGSILNEIVDLYVQGFLIFTKKY